MDGLVSCMSGRTFLPAAARLYLEIGEPSHNEIRPPERHLLSSGPRVLW